jgi:hypothetical protein
MTQIGANGLKTKGIPAIESAQAVQLEAMVSVRGNNRFVVVETSHYNYLRERELEAALAATCADLAEGRFAKESREARMARLDELA